MAQKSTFKTKFRRRQEGKTDYKKRLALVKSKKIRFSGISSFCGDYGQCEKSTHNLREKRDERE